MEYVNFVYNSLLIIFNTVVLVRFYTLYTQHNKPAFLWVSVLFFVYNVDVVLLYMADFVPPFSEVMTAWTASKPYLYMLVLFAMVLAIRMVTGHIFSLRRTKGEAALWAVVFAGMVAAAIFSGDDTSRVLRILLSKILSISIVWRAFRSLRVQADARPKEITRYLKMLYGFYSVCIALDIMLQFVDLAWNIPEYRSIVNECINVGFLAFGIAYITRYNKIATDGGKQYLLDSIAGKYGLTQREKEVFEYLSKGLSNKDISDKECISIGTVKVHTHNLYKKLGINSRNDIGQFIEQQRIA